MKIERIYILTYKDDLWWARMCVASIRYWYPDIPISLIKDHIFGPFNTRDIEKYWNVDIFETKKKCFGSGLAKLEPFFLKTKERGMVLDSDVCFAGKVLDVLEKHDEDFVVPGGGYQDITSDAIHKFFYRSEEINRKFDRNFRYPGYVFSTGHIVFTSGILTREDFSVTVDWSDLPRHKYPGVFFGNDQGILNYVLQKKERETEISIGKEIYGQLIGNKDIVRLSIDSIRNFRNDYPFLIHWCGGQHYYFLHKIPSGHILGFYRSFFYSRIKNGRLLSLFNFITENFIPYIFINCIIRKIVKFAARLFQMPPSKINKFLKRMRRVLSRI